MIKQSIINMSLATATLGLFSLAACGDSNTQVDRMEQRVDDAMAEMRRDKDAALEDLRDLRERINDRLETVDEKMAETELSEEKFSALTDEKIQLEQQRLRVETALVDVEGALESTWSDVKRTSKNVSEDVKEWLDRQAEKMDEATDADKDGDGK